MALDHPGLTVWLTGLSGSGKTTIGTALWQQLKSAGYRVELLDGDDIRRGLSSDLGFSREDRDEQVRRIGFVAELLSRNGIITIVAAISPYAAARDSVRLRIPMYLEVFVNAPLSVCESRDVKGLYRKARAGEIVFFTGINDPYELPIHPEVECHTEVESIEESTSKISQAVRARLISRVDA